MISVEVVRRVDKIRRETDCANYRIVIVGWKPVFYWLFWTLSGISPANRSRSGPKSVHMHRSRADNIHKILGTIS